MEHGNNAMPGIFSVGRLAKEGDAHLIQGL
jgi:hypothetical protein